MVDALMQGRVYGSLKQGQSQSDPYITVYHTQRKRQAALGNECVTPDLSGGEQG